MTLHDCGCDREIVDQRIYSGTSVHFFFAFASREHAPAVTGRVIIDATPVWIASVIYAFYPILS